MAQPADGTPAVPARPLSELTPKTRAPASAAVLNQWISHAEKTLGVPAAGGRMGWLVASTVVIAVLQQVVDPTGTPTFLLKGGTMLQHRLGLSARATSDVDGLVRGDLDRFIEELDVVMTKEWGPLTMTRSEIEAINAPTRVQKPRRFQVHVALRGQKWRRVQIELAPDEGGAGAVPETVPAPCLAGFGLDGPDELAVLAMRYQIAQKLHACSDPHDPPTSVNDRPRDIVDLMLLRDLVNLEGTPTLAEIREATTRVFEARARDALALNRPPRSWPCTVVAHPQWPTAYARAAADGGVTVTLDEGITAVNEWIALIDAAV